MRRGPERKARLPALALQNRDIRNVVAGFAGVTLGEWVLGTAVAVHAYTAGGALAVGFVGFRFAPAAIAGLWTTELAAHARHRRVLSATAAARATAAMLAAVAFSVGLPLTIVIGLVWLDAAVGSAYRPAQAALLPSLARSPGELTASAALVSNVKTAGQMIGALAGGLLIAGLPIAVVTGCAAALYAAAAATTLGYRRFRRPAGGPSVGLNAIATGLRTVRTRQDPRLVLAYSCSRSLLRGLWLALAVVASLKLLGLGRSGLGVLMAAGALGALGAFLAMARLVGSPRLGGWFAIGLLLCGLPVAVTGIAASGAAAIALMVVWGVGMALSDVGALTLLNRLVPAHSIGSVTGVTESGKLLFEGAGALLAPALLVGLGIRDAVVVAGCVLPILVALGFRWFGGVDARATARVDVLELLRGVPFFKPLRMDALEGVAAQLRRERHPAGAEVVRQGDPEAHRWYLVDEGELVVELDGFVIGHMVRGSQFGERALLRGVPRSATVRAVTEVTLYALERTDFLAAIAWPDAVAADDGTAGPPEPLDPATALRLTPLMLSLDPQAVARLAEHARVQELPAGASIVTAGEQDDAYHVLLKGSAAVVVNGASRRDLFAGDGFGEIAVIHRVARTATVLASEPVAVLTVDGEAVREALGVIPDRDLAPAVADRQR
jgi:CRP-like cAMP-binding protein